MKLHSPRADGSTIYEHCVAVYKSTGIWPEEYTEPIIPVSCEELWDWYWQLRQATPVGYAGPGPLLYSEIAEWAGLYQIKLQPMYLQLLLVLDRQYLNCWYENQKKQDKIKR